MVFLQQRRRTIRIFPHGQPDGLCYNPPSRRVQSPHHIMRFDLQDVALRTLILVAGGLAAVLLALKGQGQALPALAVGGTLGACVMARFGPSEQ